MYESRSRSNIIEFSSFIQSLNNAFYYIIYSKFIDCSVGMLLRWFMYLYNMEVCEEEAFLRWREDVTDAYPGKGEALFQVNAWLTWLQQQDSDDDEPDD